MATHTSARTNPPLHGARLHLEPPCARHAERMLAAIGDPALYDHIDHGPPRSAELLRQIYSRIEGRRSADGSEGGLNWAVFGPTEAPLGTVQASVPADGRARVACVLARTAWGQGDATEAVLRHLFGAPGVRLAMAAVEQANVRSHALLARLGFARAQGDAPRGHELSPTEQLWLLGPRACNRPRAFARRSTPSGAARPGSALQAAPRP